MPTQPEFDEILEDCEASETLPLETILEQNAGLLKEVFASGIPAAGKLWYRIESYLLHEQALKTADDVRRYLGMSRLYLLYNISRIPHSTAGPTQRAYQLGTYREQLRTVEADIATLTDRVAAMAAIKGRIGQRARWKATTELLDRAVQKADALWTQGSKFDRMDMSIHIQRQSGFGTINEETLYNRLRNTAKKHGKLKKPGRPRKKTSI
jgi:hypothetical protein